jgi:hypothetical protein
LLTPTPDSFNNKTSKMKNVTTALFFLVIVVAASCGGSQDPVAYNNKLMVMMNDNEKNINNMNSAMSSADYKKAEEVRIAWEADLSKTIETAEKTGSYDGSNDYRDAILKGLNTYKKIVTTDYKELIAIRAAGNPSQTDKETTLLNNINDILQKTADDANKASADFEKKLSK